MVAVEMANISATSAWLFPWSIARKTRCRKSWEEAFMSTVDHRSTLLNTALVYHLLQLDAITQEFTMVTLEIYSQMVYNIAVSTNTSHYKISRRFVPSQCERRPSCSSERSDSCQCCAGSPRRFHITTAVYDFPPLYRPDSGPSNDI